MSVPRPPDPAPAPVPDPVEADGTALALLLGLGAATTDEPRREPMRVPPVAARALEAWSAIQHGAAKDTPLRAAWLWMAHRWTGQAAGVPPSAIAPSAEIPALSYLRAVDDAGRAGLLAGSAAARILDFAMDADGSPTAIHDARIEPALVRILLERVISVAQALCETPPASESTLGDLDLVGEPARQRLLHDWNPVPAPADPEATVHERFQAQVRRHADAVALAWRDEQITYRTLADRADRLSAALRQAGVAPGSTVAVALERSPSAIASLIAVLQAGACYLPLDAAYPAARLAFMLEDGRAAVVVTTAARAVAFSGSTARVLVLADDGTLAESSAAAGSGAEADTAGHAAHARPARAADPAYVMYTSGSTGTPKGVQIPHDAILRLVVDPTYMSLDAETVMLHAAPLGFDASTLEIWGPLLNGGRCVLHPEDLPTPAGLAATIRAAGVDSAWLTAALFNAVVDDDPMHLAGLRQLLIGGEALSVPHVRRLLDALPGISLINGYGPTETTTFATTFRIPPAIAATARSVPIGRPINDTTAYILGPGMALLPAGLAGRLYVGGRGLARGYLNRPDLTTERFPPHPFDAGQRLYDTGDLARFLPDGTIEFIGRADQQVKIRGFRIEPGEIEAAIAALPGIQACAVMALRDDAGDATLAAWLVARPDALRPSAPELRAALSGSLPDFMLPSAWIWLDRLPVTANGKLDRSALPRPVPARPELATPYRAPIGPVEARLCAAIAATLGFEEVGRDDNFFELGGNSLQVLRVVARLAREGLALPVTTFFRQPTAAALAAALASPAAGSRALPRPDRPHAPERAGDEPIAIIAVAGRFPGAADVQAFWDNLCAGRDGITHFADGTLDPSLAATLLADPNYVKARGLVDGVELFDAAFFGISPREAELMDPQQRLFMELCWECLESGGHVPDDGAMPIGVFGGMYNATYYRHHVQPRPDLVEKLGEFAVMLANEKDYLATRTAHRLNLTGPAVSVHTACSTSLVAIAQAFWSLRQGQCRMALAGGASITCPPRSGYLYQEGAMLSPDGRTRSFDADAQGTVFSDGAAVVLLKRLSDALEDGNEILALIRGVGVNNDGRAKASFTAPSVDGQAAVIAQAHKVAGIDPRTVSYVEAHGTATPLGDPVEVEALTLAFRQHTGDTGFCRLGSLKSNVGHMVIAAGAAGVIKTALALAREHLPPTIHFGRANPKIDFAASPFIVNDRPTPWPRGAAPRRAGVSSFGVGGTNAHAVLEEAPSRPAPPAAHGPQCLRLSARSPAALAAMATRLADHLERHPGFDLADAAFTLQHGRALFTHRAAVVARSPAEAVLALRTAGHPLRRNGAVGARRPATVWLFPGQGAQYAGMGRVLADADPRFAAAFDEALDAVAPALGFDLRARLADPAGDALQSTEATQPALFCVEMALARIWQARGLEPVAMIGHSVGEFVAAVVAGIMSLADAARLVARRGALLQALPAGAMLSVRLPADDVQARLPQALSLAADNGPRACVVAGPAAAIGAWAAELEAAGVATRPLVTSHAFHSAMMDEAVAPFEALVREVALAPPRIPVVSSATGTWLTDDEATDPAYWARHLRAPVRFSPALRSALARHPDAVLLEVGPREVLATLARQHAGPGVAAPLAIASLGDVPDSEPDRLLLAQAQFWTAGFDLEGSAATPPQDRRRIALPTYPFERQRHWIEASAPPAAVTIGLQTVHSSRKTASTPSAAAPSGPDLALPSEATPLPNPSVSPAMSSPAPAAPRRPALIARLRDLFGDVAGLDLTDADPTAAFVEFGIDSLTLTQVAMQTRRRFGVAVTFRQLSESLRSFDTLAEFLDGAMPLDPAAPTPAPAGVAPDVAPAQPASTLSAPAPRADVVPPLPTFAAPAGAGVIQQVIAQQMALMAQQLAMLGGASSGVPAAAWVDPPSASPAPAPAPAASSQPVTATPVPVAVAATDDQGALRYDVKKAFGAIARIHTQASEITARQRARLDAFMRRYVERTARSKAYTTQHRGHLADPRVVNGFRPVLKEITYQIVIDKSRGSHMWDLDGNEYVDVLSGFGMNMFGWQPAFVQDAVRAQLDAGYEIGPQHPLAGEVADLVCELTGADRAGLCNTGSEAVMAAIRIARTVTCRNTVVLFTGSYHGTFDEVLVRAGRNAKGIPAAPGIMADVFDDVRVLDYGTPEALEFIRRNADDLAAVLLEPVQSRRPEFQPREFLKQVREITEASGTCLIFDEVITGFRTHPGGVQAMFDIRADLTTYGKVIGGGFPIGVIAGKRDYMDALDGGGWHFGDDSVPTVGVTYFAGTFVRHPLALAAAKASLLHLKEQGPQLQEQLNLRTAAMADELGAFCREVGAPIEIRHFGSLWRVAWLEDHPLQDLLFAMMRSRGVHILDNFPCFMTTAHTPQDIATIKSAFKESVAELQQAEFLPRRAAPEPRALDVTKPPVPGAKLGRGPNGEAQWYVPHPDEPGKYVVAR